MAPAKPKRQAKQTPKKGHRSPSKRCPAPVASAANSKPEQHEKVAARQLMTMKKLLSASTYSLLAHWSGRTKLSGKHFMDIQKGPKVTKNGYFLTPGRTFAPTVLAGLKSEAERFINNKGVDTNDIALSCRQVVYSEMHVFDINEPPKKELILLETLLRSVLSPFFKEFRFFLVSLLKTKAGIKKKKWQHNIMHMDFREDILDKGKTDPVVLHIPLESVAALEFGVFYKQGQKKLLQKKTQYSSTPIKPGGMCVMGARQFHATGNPFKVDEALQTTTECARLHIAMSDNREQLTQGYQAIDPKQDKSQFSQHSLAVLETMKP